MDLASQSKQILREKWRKEYPKSAELREKLSANLCGHLKKQPLFRQASKISIFFPRPFEVILTSLWENEKEKFVFPRVDKKNHTLEFFWISDLADLEPTSTSLLEPRLHCRKVTDWESADLILVPGLAFDAWGGRVGSGKGYYDRFLSTVPRQVQKWGVSFLAQIVKERLDQIATDVRMDALCSEAGWVGTRG